MFKADNCGTKPTRECLHSFFRDSKGDDVLIFTFGLMYTMSHVMQVSMCVYMCVCVCVFVCVNMCVYVSYAAVAVDSAGDTYAGET